jgi:uncharacterized membrane protein
MTMEQERGQEQYNYEIYREERRYLLEAHREQSVSFDKTLTTLATAMFAFSVAYIQLLQPQPLSSRCLLVCCWVCLGVALFAVLSSFMASQQACIKQIDIVEAEFLGPDDHHSDKESTNRWASLTGVLNFVGLVAFFAGIIAFSLFVVANLPH